MPRGKVRGRRAPSRTSPAPEKRPTRPARGKVASTSTPPPAPAAVGYHPYYCAISEAREYVVVKTFHGREAVEVSKHETPREAIDRMIALNEEVESAAAARAASAAASHL